MPSPSPLLPLLCGALLTPVLFGCPGEGAEGGNTDGTTQQITTASVTDTTGSGPTSTPTGLTDTPTDTSSSGCLEGAVQCVSVDQRQVCKAGAWVDDLCPDGEGCGAFGGCVPCTCTESVCADAATINECACLDLVARPCGPNTACDELGGQVACHSVMCGAGQPECADDKSVKTCNASGTAYLPPTPCGKTELCEYGKCLPACDVVATNDSSLGCDFWAVDMANVPPRDAYLFGVAISNPSADADVHVKIFDRNNGGLEQLIAQRTITPRQAEVFQLSGKQGGKVGFYPGDAGFLGTGIAKGRAFRIQSDLPVVATQFNPLGGTAALTTDASLLLPTHTLGTEYYHLAWEKGKGAGSSMVIVATEDDTIITVKSTATTNAGQNGMPALVAGTEMVLPKLAKYDYVQVSSASQDLSASRISANAPVAVFGGHSCGQVPSKDVEYCDHLEEQIFPIATWGSHYVAARSPARASEPMVWRILASKDDTDITFNPPVSIGAKYDNLAAGKLIQFTADVDFDITSTRPILVAGYMYGCTATNIPDCPGDPSMVLAVPVEQWLSDYVFLVDLSYADSKVKLVRQKGDTVAVGCLGEVTDWTPVAGSYESAVVTFNGGLCNPGTNTATGDSPFSITVVGESASTSYAYPGGLQLKPINPG